MSVGDNSVCVAIRQDIAVATTEKALHFPPVPLCASDIVLPLQLDKGEILFSSGTRVAVPLCESVNAIKDPCKTHHMLQKIDSTQVPQRMRGSPMLKF